MNKKLNTLIITLVLLGVLILSFVAYNALSENYTPPPNGKEEDNGSSAGSETERIKTIAPDFVVYDESENKVTLSEFLGTPVVLNFWASWCDPCKLEMPHFQRLYEEMGGEVTFMMVNLTDNSSETVKTAQKYISDNGYTFPVYFDNELDAAAAYSVYGIPTTYCIDAEGIVAKKYIKSLTESDLTECLTSITG